MSEKAFQMKWWLIQVLRNEGDFAKMVEGKTFQGEEPAYVSASKSATIFQSLIIICYSHSYSPLLHNFLLSRLILLDQDLQDVCLQHVCNLICLWKVEIFRTTFSLTMDNFSIHISWRHEILYGHWPRKYGLIDSCG